MTTSRRVAFATAIALAVSVTSIGLAQNPGGRGGGGPGGPGGPGGRGGFGGPGGFGGGSITGLLQFPAVQEELKLTDAQKTKVKEILDASNKKRGELFGGGRGNRTGGPGGPGGPGGQGGGGTGGGRGGRGGGNPTKEAQAKPVSYQQLQPQQPGQAGGQGGGRGGRGGGAGGPGGFGNMTDEQRVAMQQRFATMQAQTETLQKETEAAIAKVLDSKQRLRLAQIHLQRQGLQAFATQDLKKRLNISDAKFAEIQETLAGMGQARREQFTKMRDVFTQFAGNNNGGRPDRAAMQERMQDPKFQELMTKTRKEMETANETLEAQMKLKIGASLTKKQREAYTKMLGEPFDLAKLGGGPGGPGRPGGPGGPGAPGAAAAAKPATPPAGQAPAGAAAPKSLRERRGGTSN